MQKWILAVSFWLFVFGPTYSVEIVQVFENSPSVLPSEDGQGEDVSLVDRQIHEKLEQFIKNCTQKKYAERLERFSENEWDAAGWYLFMLAQVVDEGENCDYLKWYDKPLRVNAIAVLESEIEEFLAEHE
jgi:Tfp pilus assembly protein PilN